ncbi:superfamily II DNA/RNA helicase [Microbacterium sp. W4I4]|nr:superfamily II DNA/RNA helicase [Microbacterium sp. W4I4]
MAHVTAWIHFEAPFSRHVAAHAPDRQTHTVTSFADLGIDQDILDALAAKGIVDAFPIQEQTIPLGLPGQDIIGQAKTGTGKTFGFGIPLVQRLGQNPEPGVKALVVVPTRELAVQVFEDIDMLTSNRPTSVVAIYGGKAYEGQIDQLKAGAQIVVGTPGRLIDLANQRLLDLSNATEVVLDEADKMLDLGFLADIEKIFSKVAPVRHTQLFSATMPGPIVALARRFMTNPIHIRANDPDEGLMQANIKHVVYRAHSLDKDEIIARILQAEGRGKTVIFTRTKRAAQRLVDELGDRGFNVGGVHGDMGQEQRERSMAAFKAGKRDVLVATDVAARGIDVDDVTHVINHTIPDEDKTYLHRAGRTGRAGKTGIAVTFVDWEDLHKWALINRALDFGQPEPVETYSSSPHLFSDLDIPEGTKGRLRTAPKAEKPASERKQRQPQKAADAAAEGTDEGTTRRRRRRNRGSSGEQVGSTFIEGAEKPASDSGAATTTVDRDAEGAGTHDGDATREHRDGKPAPQRRRRRRRSGGAAPTGA